MAWWDDPVGAAVAVTRTTLTTVRRTAEVAASLPRIALALERLADGVDDLRRVADAAPSLAVLSGAVEDLRTLLRNANPDDLAVARDSVVRLADAVAQLNSVVASLNTTVSPLQGATERLGRLVDRFPQGRRRIVDVEP